MHTIPGTNSRLDSIQAAILNVKLDFLDTWNEKRRQAAYRYSEALTGIEEIRTPELERNRPLTHVFHLYVITCERRDELLAFLAERRIQAQIHYPVPVHLHPAFAHLGLGVGNCAQAERLAGQVLSLPLFPEITDEQIHDVASAIRCFYGYR